MEGRGQAFTVESERKLVLFGKVDALKDQVERVTGDGRVSVARETHVVKAVTDAAEPVKVADHGEREMMIKQWTTDQLRDNYGDFERLLQAKTAELRAMIDNLQANMEANPGAQGGGFAGTNQLEEEV